MVHQLTHITDVGSASGDGVDSSLRIQKQYQRLGVQPQVISAGHSPLHVAFAACTDVEASARNRAAQILEFLEHTTSTPAPVALNSAPRNAATTKDNGQEDHIFRVRSENPGEETLLIYGPEVLQWVLTFRDRAAATVDRIISIGEWIPDTSNGTQFRSAAHLPIAHVLEAHGRLDQVAKTEPIDIESITDRTPGPNEAVILPSDEYGNGRLLLARQLWQDLRGRDQILIPGLTEGPIHVHQSLTQVKPGELSAWQSSNNFAAGVELSVVNIGTRWATGTTRTTDASVIQLGTKLRSEAGKTYPLAL
jgi:hypothetical protein